MTDDDDAENILNPYGFYFELNDEKPFWAWKGHWGHTRLLVRRFEAPSGPPPYYGNPRASYEVWKRDRGGEWKQVSSHGYNERDAPSWGTHNWTWQECSSNVREQRGSHAQTQNGRPGAEARQQTHRQASPNAARRSPSRSARRFRS